VLGDSVLFAGKLDCTHIPQIVSNINFEFCFYEKCIEIATYRLGRSSWPKQQAGQRGRPKIVATNSAWSGGYRMS